MQKSEIVELIRGLSYEVKDNPSEWENRGLPTFLSAMADWIEDMDGYYKNSGQEQPGDKSFDFLRDVLMAARVYE